MSKPLLLLAIDEHLKTIRPAGIRAWADDAMASAIRQYATEMPVGDGGEDAPPIVPSDPFMRQWWYRSVEIAAVTTLGFGTRINEAFRFRDPETGQFV